MFSSHDTRFSGGYVCSWASCGMIGVTLCGSVTDYDGGFGQAARRIRALLTDGHVQLVLIEDALGGLGRR
jgi:hypothetical protein